MKTVRFPLVGSYTNRNVDPASSTGKDQQFINCYPTVAFNPLTGKNSLRLNKRPGSTKGASLSGVNRASEIGAMVSWTGHSASAHPIVATFINSLPNGASVWDLTTDTKIGSDITTVGICTAMTETMVSGTATLVANFLNGSNVAEQWYFPEGGAWTQVSDADFTAHTIVGFPAHLDGYVFNMTLAGKILNADLNSVSAYSSASFISANAYPDTGVTVARHGPHIVGFGTKSIEFFYNAGNASGSPLSRVEGSTIHMGAAQRDSGEHQSVLVGHGTIYWIGTNSEGAVTGIYRFKGMAPEKISTPAIDNLLATGQILGFAGTAILHGMNNVVLRATISGTDRTFAYCVDTKFWWEIKLANGVIRACLAAAEIDATVSANAESYFTCSANAGGNQFAQSTAAYQDDGSNYTMTVQTESIDFGTRRRKFFRSLSLIGDDQSSSSNVGVSYSDDDSANFSTARNIDMGSGQVGTLKNLQSSRSRAWKFTNTANTPMRLEAVEIDYDEALT